jgi:hypothetical protein
MRTGEKKKLIGAGLLLLVAVAWLYFSISPSSSAASAPDATAPHQAINSLAKGDPAASSSSSSAKQHIRNLTGPLTIDPVLRLDLLAKAQTVKYDGSDRNIFQFYTAPPPPLPKPAVGPVIGPNNTNGPPPPPQAVQPPPPPSIPLKYYGVVTTLGTSARKACLQDGEDIFVAAEGELVKKRYRVVRINDLGSEHNVEVEDTQSKVKAKIPLQEGGDKS